MSLPENSRTEDGIAAWIKQLASHSAPAREVAAKGLFARGWAKVESCARPWLRDNELGACFVLDDSGFPKTTVGIAVHPDTFERVRKANAMPRLADVPPDQDAREFELHFSGGVQLDILTTLAAEANGAIARFLSKFGEGIQQVELCVANLERATQLLDARFGLKAIYPASRDGADGTRVNFFLVASQDGKLLVELVEVAK